MRALTTQQAEEKKKYYSLLPGMTAMRRAPSRRRVVRSQIKRTHARAIVILIRRSEYWLDEAPEL